MRNGACGVCSSTHGDKCVPREWGRLLGAGEMGTEPPKQVTAHKRLQEYMGTRRSTFLISPSPTESGLAQTGPEAGILRHLLVAPVAEPPPLS